MGSLSLLQGIFPPQGLNPGLPHCRWILYQLSHEEIINSSDYFCCVFSIFYFLWVLLVVWLVGWYWNGDRFLLFFSLHFLYFLFYL